MASMAAGRASRRLAWNQLNRRQLLITVSLCAVFGAMVVPLRMHVAYLLRKSSENPSATDASFARQKQATFSDPVASVAVSAPISDIVQIISPPPPANVSSDVSNGSKGSAALLSDVSTMDLMMPIAEPDLDIASPQSLWAQVGRESGVDPLLLYSVALVESRSLLPGGKVGPTPWLFRVNDHLVLGERHHVQLEMAAASQLGSAVQDVGIMQVYYPMHRDAARDPLTLLDPRTNISVAAKILHDGMHETRDPVLGVGYYHSHTPQLAEDYGTVVLTVYQRLKGIYGRGRATRAVAR